MPVFFIVVTTKTFPRFFLFLRILFQIIKDKGLICKIYKKFIQPNSKETVPLKSGQKTRHFSKEDIKTVNKYTKRVLIIKKCKSEPR